MKEMVLDLPLKELRALFGERLREKQPIGRFTSARIGGSADLLIDVLSADDLAEAARHLWQLNAPFFILGGGSNILVSDLGVRGVVVLNHARKVRFEKKEDGPYVRAESGANFGAVARQAARKGLSGLEWAAGIPGTVGGAVVGNAGAHGGDISQCLNMADILHQDKGRQEWSAQDLDFNYRDSFFKQHPGKALLLAASLRLAPKGQDQIQSQMDTFLAHRRLTQPPGASMGSMFKNPPDDFAGRLIEAAGLKGKRIGDAQISPLHANFFLNLGEAKAADVFALISRAREEVAEHFDVELELEIELVGEWDE